MADIDYFTIMLLADLFIVVGGISQAGVVDDLSRVFMTIGQGNSCVGNNFSIKSRFSIPR